MAVALLYIFRFVRLLLSGQQAVALENAALRMQIAAYRREKSRPKLTDLDRWFWIALRQVWSNWRRALLYVQPDTVVRWQRERFRNFWARLSKPSGRLWVYDAPLGESAARTAHPTANCRNHGC
jgi:hypothetical protein